MACKPVSLEVFYRSQGVRKTEVCCLVKGAQVEDRIHNEAENQTCERGNGEKGNGQASGGKARRVATEAAAVSV
jgi:hypothetical protein